MPILYVMIDLLVRHIFSIDCSVVFGRDLLLGLILASVMMVSSVVTVKTFVVLSRRHGFLTEGTSFRMRINRLTLLPETEVLHV
jgi:hypothetical protein